MSHDALQKGKNVLVDGSLRNTYWYQEYFTDLRLQFPTLKIAIIHVTAQEDTVLRRAEARANYTGRKVPAEVILESMRIIPESLKVLSPMCDFVASFSNEDGGDGPTMEYCIMYDQPGSNSSSTVDAKEYVPNSSDEGNNQKDDKNSDRGVRIPLGVVRWSIRKCDHHYVKDEEQSGMSWKLDSWQEEFKDVWAMQCALFPTPADEKPLLRRSKIYREPTLNRAELKDIRTHGLS